MLTIADAPRERCRMSASRAAGYCRKMILPCCYASALQRARAMIEARGGHARRGAMHVDAPAELDVMALLERRRMRRDAPPCA